MRGADTFTESLFPMKRLSDFDPADHPLREIREIVIKALMAMNTLFTGMYEADIKGGRPSIAPENLLRAMLLQVIYSVRSERMLIGADPIQHALSLVCGFGHGRCSVGAHGLQQEPPANH